jgi:F0F1-type ATP synthase assembly protein I
MPEELSKEILRELKEINEKLDKLNERKGLSSPMKIIALFFGFVVVGPIIALLLSRFFN